MNDSEKIRAHSTRWERYAWVLAVVWTVVVAASLVWNVVQVRHNTLEAARIQARVAHGKDVIYRRWNAGYGGVYVPVTEVTKPNPYLSYMPERDITTPSGKLLTLMNPAYMTRQVHELAEEEYGVRGHITSLNPIRPENAPDPWETEALQAFERGETEISSVEEMEGKGYMRLMRPLITEKGCLKCHAAQGYQEGDIRGGISVSIPVEPLWAVARMQVLTLAGGHVLLWLMGLGGIVLGTQWLARSERERKRAEEELSQYRDHLEDLVKERTAELAAANEQLQQEITERKRAEEEIAGLARFPSENSNPVLRVAKDGTVLYTNEAGLPLLNVWGRQVNQPLPDDWRKFTSDVFSSGASKDTEVEVDDRILSLTFAPVVDAGYVNVYGLDVTERVRAEEALRVSEERFTLAVRGSNDGLWDWDILNNSLYWSPRLKELIEYADDELDMDFDTFDSLLHPDDREHTGAAIEAHLKDGGLYDVEQRLRTKSGQYRWFRARGQALWDEAGNPLRMVGSTTDITERVRAEEEREVLIAELEAKNAELERFTYTVSHDLKSPLITIQGFLGLLEQDAAAGETEQMKADMTRISNAAEKMRRLLDELLELSRIGRLVNPPEEVPLGELAREAVDLVAGRLAERGVRVEIADDLPVVYGDRPRLREVLENLVDNGVKFMGDQPNPRLEIGARRDGEETVFYVRDNGVGIDPRYHEKIFGLFEQLNAKTEGTGVGLAIVKRIVEVHGGRVWVESEGAGQGSTFCFTLPGK